MHAQNTFELIAMAENPRVSDQEFVDAYVHYTPGSDGAYSALLTAMLTKRRSALKVLGVTLQHARRTRAMLIALQQRLKENFAS
ncbi:MAG: hypothetical protein AAB424_00060 [Patescibacteria group bacterium]